MTRPSTASQAQAHVAPHAALLALAIRHPIDPSRIHWPTVVALAEREGMVLRVIGALAESGLPAPPDLTAAADRAAGRAAGALHVVARLAAFCELRDISYVFPKLEQSLPDIGRDIDLLVAPGAAAIPLPASPIPVDVQRGRVGWVGEHSRFALDVLSRRERVETNAGPRAIPCAEDRLLLLVVSRIFGRPGVRLADVAFVTRLLRDGTLDLDRLVAHAEPVGLLDALSCFLEYVDQVARRLIGVAVLDGSVRPRLTSGPWGRVELERGVFRGSFTRVIPYLYARLAAGRFVAGDLEAVGRVAMLPVTVAARHRASAARARSAERQDA